MNASEVTHIADVLGRGNDTQLLRLLEKCESERKMDLLLETIVQTCRNAPLRLNSTFMPALGRYFSTLTSLAAYNQGMEFLAMLQEQLQSGSTVATLLRLLVQNAQILNATRLREELVKGELVELHQEITMTEKNEEVAANLAICVYSALAVEASYAPNPDRTHWSRIGKLWDGCVKDAESSIVAQFCTILLNSLLCAHMKQRGIEGWEECESRIGMAGDAIFRGGLLSSLTTHLNSTAGQPPSDSLPCLLFELLLPGVATLHHRLTMKRFRRLVKFLVGAARRFSRTAELKTHFARLVKCCDVGVCELESLLRDQMEPHGLWSTPAPFTPPPNEFAKVDGWLQGVSTKQVKDASTAPRLIQFFIQLQLNAMVAKRLGSGDDTDTADTGSLSQIADEQGLGLLALLENFAQSRREFRLEFTQSLACLMLDEGALPVRSLQLAAVMLKMHNGNLPTLNALVSFSLSLCRPVAYKLLPEGDAEKVDFYVLAKTRLLIAALKHAPMVVRSRVPIVCGLLPDLFQQLSIYWEGDSDSTRKQAERLEHALVCLCKEMETEKSTFHRHVPFVVSNSMTGEREMSYPMFVLLSMCDSHDMALMATNFPPKEKRKFAMLQAQFYAANRIIG